MELKAIPVKNSMRNNFFTLSLHLFSLGVALFYYAVVFDLCCPLKIIFWNLIFFLYTRFQLLAVLEKQPDLDLRHICSYH